MALILEDDIKWDVFRAGNTYVVTISHKDGISIERSSDQSELHAKIDAVNELRRRLDEKEEKKGESIPDVEPDTDNLAETIAKASESLSGFIERMKKSRRLDGVSPADKWDGDETEGVPSCLVTNGGYHCNRDKNHSGQHVASDGRHVVCVWANENDSKAVDDVLDLREGDEWDGFHAVSPDIDCDMQSNRGWYCNREPNHLGPHIATNGEEVLQVWTEADTMAGL